MQGSPGYLLPCNLLQPRWDLPTHPWSPETEEEGMGLPRMAGTGGLAWAALYYLRVLPGKCPEAWRVTVEPKSRHVKKLRPWGFWKPEPRQVGKQQENIFH